MQNETTSYPMGRRHDGRGVDLRRFPRAFFQPDKVLEIPLRSPDGRKIGAHGRKPRAGHKVQKAAQDFQVYLFIPDDALFADLVPPGLKLGF